MVAKYLIVFLFISLGTFTFAQFNLKNLDSLSVQFKDEESRITSVTEQKIVTETKLKLMSAGIDVSSDAKNRFIINVRAIMSNFAEHRILLQVEVFENVKTERKDSIETQAITYYDDIFFKGKNINEDVYNSYMDKLLISFIENYLSSN